MVLASLWMVANALAGPSWADLAPWRTWLIVEDVEPARTWFVVPNAPGGGQYCEVAVGTDHADPIVTCGVHTLGAVPYTPVSAALRKPASRARKALAAYLGVRANEIALQDMMTVGPSSRVTFRQVVITDPKADPRTSLARVVESRWDVSLENGKVTPTFAPPTVATRAVCVPGTDKRCDGEPWLLPYEAPKGAGVSLWIDGDGVLDAEILAALEAAVRLAPTHKRLDTLPPIPQGLPEDLNEGVLYRVLVTAEDASGSFTGMLQIEQSLTEALIGMTPIGTRLDVGDAILLISAVLGDGRVTLTLRGADGSEQRATYNASCPLVVHDAIVGLKDACTIDNGGSWLVWEGAGGVRLMAQLGATAKPRLGSPSLYPVTFVQP